MKFLRLRWTILPVAIVLLLASLPELNDSRTLLILMTKIFVYAVFAMSYDLLLGYTGIISFGHAMFFGIGAYSVGIGMDVWTNSLGTLVLSVSIGAVAAAVVSYIVGMLSLRLKTHFYAMLTLAFSGLFVVAAEKMRSVTNGADGFPFAVPEFFMDRTNFYYISLTFMVIVFLLLRRFTHSPVGKVLQAIRENEQRTQSIGYEVVHYKIIASVVAGVAAALSGSMYAITLRFVNTTVFSMDITIMALLMTIIGGVGTLYGGIIGAALIEYAHELLTSLAKVHVIFERWIIFFGLLYILVVMIFPMGIVGTVKRWQINRKAAAVGKRGGVPW